MGKTPSGISGLLTWSPTAGVCPGGDLISGAHNLSFKMEAVSPSAPVGAHLFARVLVEMPTAQLTLDSTPSTRMAFWVHLGRGLD